MQGLKIGHYTDVQNGTGISVFLLEKARGAYLLCGSGPASHELGPLEVNTSVDEVHALVLSGGSAFGLFSAKGVMQFLVENKIGVMLPHGVVPIVPAAAIYDLAYKNPVYPNDEQAYQACLNAKENNNSFGNIGAGTGATVGKLIPHAECMPGGFGYAEMSLGNGVEIIVCAVVNAVGDILENNKIISGAKLADGSFANCANFLMQATHNKNIFPTANTSLVAVFVNAKFSKSELQRIAKMAIAGMARAIAPVFTCYDGDLMFVFSVGDKSASVINVGTAAAELVNRAIVKAVKE